MPSPEINIAVKRLPHGAGLPLPAYGSEHAVGLDVVAAENLTLAPGARVRLSAATTSRPTACAEP